MAIKHFPISILVIISVMCSCQKAAPPKEISVIIKNSHEPRRYPEGFTAFLGVVDLKGAVRVPIRYAMSPRKGFMDNVKLEKRVQNPVFWGTDAMTLSLDGVSAVESVVVGHRSRDETEWTVVLVNVAGMAKDAEGNYKINSSVFEQAEPVRQTVRDQALIALEEAKTEYERLSNSEP